MTNDALIVFRHEWTGFVRSGALFLLVLIVSAVGVASMVLEANTWIEENTLRTDLRTQETEQWLGLGDTHIHKAAHLGYFVVRDLPPGAVLDRGVWDYGGSAIWLEAHRRNAPQLRAADNASVIARGAPRGVGPVLLWLTPLLLVVLFHGVVAGERATGSLAFAVSSGASPTAIVTGKALAVILGAWAAAVLPLALGASFAVSQELSALSALIWVLSVLGGISAFAGIVVIVSSLTKRPLGALIALLIIWFVMAAVWPRLTPSLANQYAPIPSSQIVRSEAEVAAEGLVFNETEKAVRAELAEAGVTEANPGGVSAMAAEIDAARAFAEIFAPLEQGMARQASILDLLSWASPIAAADRSADAVLGLSDRDQFAFEARAEAIRIATQMTLNEGWARSAGDDRGAPALWREVVDASASIDVDRKMPSVAGLGLVIWALVLAGGLHLSARSVQQSMT